MNIIKCDLCNEEIRIITSQNYWRNNRTANINMWMKKLNLHKFTNKIKSKQDIKDISIDNEDICNKCYTRINTVILKEIENIKKNNKNNKHTAKTK